MGIKNRLYKIVQPPVGISNARTRELWLEKVLHTIPSHSRILDAGAGTQRYKRFCGHLDYVSQDFGLYDGQGDAVGLQTGEFDYGRLDIVCDITAIPEPDEAFDAIMCIEVLEHLPNPVLALQEFARLLKPAGELILTAPFCSVTHYAPYHFSTGFNTYWYQTHLQALGLETLEINRNGNFFEYLAQEIYRLPAIVKRYAKGNIHLVEYVALLIFQRMLLRFSKRDQGSSELLCFGYHIRARKKVDR